MAHLDNYLRLALSLRGSDLHFASNEPVRLRVDGDLQIADANPLTPENIEAIFAEILTEEEREKLWKNRNLDRSYTLEGVASFRINIFYTRKGISAVLRTIPNKIPTCAELGLPEVIPRLTELPKGLILVTGPTGSGKSTTLAAMINHINSLHPYHILTVEDPVEFVHPSKQCLVNQREIGASCHSFSDALKYALREDPDVILVGEMRDLETISLALTAAETGHLVFGTLHTRGAAASIDRIIDSFPANQQGMVRAMLSESLVAVISQALLKKASGGGRVAAYEIMVVNHAISNLIREGKTFQIPSIIQTSRREGMVLMEQHIRDLIVSSVITTEEGETILGAGGAHGGSGGKGKAAAPPIPGKPPAQKAFAPLEGGAKPPLPPNMGSGGPPRPPMPPPMRPSAPPAAPAPGQNTGIPAPPSGAGLPPGFAPLKMDTNGGSSKSMAPQPPPPPSKMNSSMAPPAASPTIPPPPSKAPAPPPPAVPDPGVLTDLTEMGETPDAPTFMGEVGSTSSNDETEISIEDAFEVNPVKKTG